MRSASDAIRLLNVRCNSLESNKTCYYDDKLKEICSSFMYPYQLWRFFTASLLHMVWYHLVINVSKQALYGFLLERKYGTIRVSIIYWLSALSSCLTFMLEHREAPGFGASGSIYGLIIFLTVDRLVALQENTEHRAFIFLQIIVLIVLPNAPTIILIYIFKLNAAHSAHIGGGLVGLLLGIGMIGCPLPWSYRQCHFRTMCRCIAFTLLFIYFTITVTIFFLMDPPVPHWLFEF
ncbi:unnamed protein product [Adineta ricciae]|uniref:rhomboid protease n=1 Tax=Adineta ricciae TaxID=249248 RepID=A0A816CAR7_ADIRI|nr:unnamed protein product [Adineta ricciae]